MIPYNKNFLLECTHLSEPPSLLALLNRKLLFQDVACLLRTESPVCALQRSVKQVGCQGKESANAPRLVWLHMVYTPLFLGLSATPCKLFCKIFYRFVTKQLKFNEELPKAETKLASNALSH